MSPPNEPLHPCPCCDYFTLPARGDWDICPVCFWEDDGSDLARPEMPSGCNHGLTLREARANVARLGACEEAMHPHVCAAAERQRYRHQPRSLRRH
jgi:hypothetical protein